MVRTVPFFNHGSHYTGRIMAAVQAVVEQGDHACPGDLAQVSEDILRRRRSSELFFITAAKKAPLVRAVRELAAQFSRRRKQGFVAGDLERFPASAGRLAFLNKDAKTVNFRWFVENRFDLDVEVGHIS